MRHSKRWYRSKRCQLLLLLFAVVLMLCYWFAPENYSMEPDLARRETIVMYIEQKLQEALKQDKGTGCNMPKLDPFSKEIIELEKTLPKIVCPGEDWVKCYMSECKVKESILKSVNTVHCTYRDIIYRGDQKDAAHSASTTLEGDQAYLLQESDHVKVDCTGKNKTNGRLVSWSGFALGFRLSATPPTAPPGRERGLNVAILAFDSTSHSGFIRRMPNSYKVLTTMLNATILNSYNVLGDGTPASLFPILTGKTELEYPDVRRAKSRESIDFMPFIFYKLKDDGFRTAYFEDMPWIGTFTYRFNGFKRQPADHYLRAFFMEESAKGKRWSGSGPKKYCVGDTPRFQLMLNATEQFMSLDGKKYSFTFIADITHDDFNHISTADDATAEFLLNYKESGRQDDTLLLVMGDHGSRFSAGRNTLIGKLEERLPLMAIVLPEALKREWPEAQGALEGNKDVLTTPHDIYATVLDVLDLRQHWNPYKIPGADLARGLTLLEAIPRNRSCSEAGIEPHWCACLAWRPVPANDPLHRRAAEAFVQFINALTEPIRNKCVKRNLESIEWVTRQEHNSGLLQFSNAKDNDGYIGKFDANTKVTKENYQVKVTVGPGSGVYEASLVHDVNHDTFHLSERDISRVNAYGDQPACISVSHPHLNMYCYCAR